MLSKPYHGALDSGAVETSAAVGSTAPATTVERNVKALFHVVGDADVGFIQRVVQPIAKVGASPSRLFASTEDGDGSLMSVDLRVAEISETMARRIENHLRSIVGVHQVIAVYES